MLMTASSIKLFSHGIALTAVPTFSEYYPISGNDAATMSTRESDNMSQYR